MFPFTFSFNPWSLFFLLLTVPPWIASFIFSFRYIQKEKYFFYTFFFLTFTANILFFVAKDPITLLIIYEFLSLASVPLVFFEKTKEAIKAGKIYFFFSLISGILVFAGTMMLSYTSHLQTAYILMCLGFLIKCGAFPFHVWLPVAHPVAPSPASAILSGCIIKAGYYGLFRVILLWSPSEKIGYYFLVIALVTMLYGVLQALFQTNCKRMLAYHSVSQMGYILLGIAVYIMTHESVSLAGSLMHAMNHAYFKSALFLAIGILYLDSHTLDMYKMKGYLKKAPIISLLFLVAILGITGTPFFNGFVSKTFIHEELLLEKEFIFKLAESIFLFTAIGTFVSNFKMYYLITLRPIPIVNKCKKDSKEIFSLSILALCILGFGLYPLIERYILPLHYFPHLTELLEEITPFHKLFFENITGFLWIAAAGLSLMYIGLKWNWFHKKIPLWVDPLYWIDSFYQFFQVYMITFFQHIEVTLIFLFSWITRKLSLVLRFDDNIDKLISKSVSSFYNKQIQFLIRQSIFEKKFNQAISYAVIPGNQSASASTSLYLNQTETKINSLFKDLSLLVRFLFSITERQEKRNRYQYDKLLKDKGRNIVFVLVILILLFTLIFLFIFWRFFP